MHPAIHLFGALNADRLGSQRRAAAWRELHQRPDAAPCPREVAGIGLIGRVIAWAAPHRTARSSIAPEKEQTA
jgi:hypothetical protein